MKKLVLVALAAAAVVTLGAPDQAEAGRRKKASNWGMRFAQTQPWHGDYYHTATGSPVAMVVPPTAHMQRSYGWGVAQSSMTPIYHQFGRPYPGDGGEAGVIDESGMFQPTPRWPSHTDQFGVYYVRGPWGGTVPRSPRHNY